MAILEVRGLSSATRQAREAAWTATNREPEASIADLIAGGQVRSLYQPIVDLYSGAIVGYEALARGPGGSSLEHPDRLFTAARNAGLTADLEWACQSSALNGALNSRLPPGQALFMNLESGVPMSGRPAHLAHLTKLALSRFDIFVELTERALTDRPAELLATVERIRAQGARIALDDVGADPRSLALMPFLAPEIVKLDLRLVQENPSRQIAAIVHAVNAEAERTGAVILAEGIETEAHRQTALALGARYGQGWLFGRPAELGPPGPQSNRVPTDRRDGARSDQSPFEIVTANRATRLGTKQLLLALSLQIEAQAAGLGTSRVLLSTFQEAAYFTPRTASRYERLARQAALVGALGVDLPDRPAENVRGVALDLADPLRGEWDVTVIAPHFAVAFVARDLGDRGTDMQRRFDFALTYERDLAIAAASAMMGRLASA